MVRLLDSVDILESFSESTRTDDPISPFIQVTLPFSNPPTLHVSVTVEPVLAYNSSLGSTDKQPEHIYNIYLCVCTHVCNQSHIVYKRAVIFLKLLSTDRDFICLDLTYRLSAQRKAGQQQNRSAVS